MVTSAQISSIMKDGILIYTRFANSIAWYSNTVLKYKGNEVQIPLLKCYLENIILPGTRMILKHTNEYFEYLFDCTVIKIEPDYPSTVTLSISNAEEVVNSRIYIRHCVNLAVNLKSKWDSIEHFAVTTNLSLGGISFISIEEFDYGDECDVSIYISDSAEKRIINVKGKIVRKSLKKDYIDYSMQFTEIPDISKKFISEYIETINLRSSDMLNEYHKNV